jgi:membrane fusion protein (multidrug efflux system)
MTTMPDDVSKPMTTVTPDRSAQRKKFLSIFAGFVVAGGVGFGGYDGLVLSNYASTDNAYVGGDMAQITPQVAAAVTSVNFADADAVKAGDVLVQLDDSDARIAQAKAAANLASTTRRVEQIFATSRALGADLLNRQAAIHHAEANQMQARAAFDKAAIDLKRREDLQSSGAVSAEELTIAKNAFVAAQSALNASNADVEQAKASLQTAQNQKAANDALIDDTTVENNPDVLAAKSQLDQANLDLTRTTLKAPFAGVVAQRHVQVGQRVKVGDNLMAVVPVGQLYVDANFKENQLAKVRPGQKVELTSDLYGSGFTYHGKVLGFDGGTGAAMAIIPAQNATGNWIKVVQRLPVRVQLDPGELVAHPLRIGLSMYVTVDLKSGS